MALDEAGDATCLKVGIALTGLSREDLDGGNGQLQKRMPASINDDIDRLTSERSEIALRHGQITADQYSDTQGGG